MEDIYLSDDADLPEDFELPPDVDVPDGVDSIIDFEPDDEDSSFDLTAEDWSRFDRA